MHITVTLLHRYTRAHYTILQHSTGIGIGTVQVHYCMGTLQYRYNYSTSIGTRTGTLYYSTGTVQYSYSYTVFFFSSHGTRQMTNRFYNSVN